MEEEEEEGVEQEEELRVRAGVRPALTSHPSASPRLVAEVLTPTLRRHHLDPHIKALWPRPPASTRSSMELGRVPW